MMRIATTPFGPCRTYINKVPPAFRARSPRKILRGLEGPTIVVFDQGLPKTRVVSCLVHGNESSGFHAVTRAMQTQPQSQRANMIYFIGNVQAALSTHRAFGRRTSPLTDVDKAYWDMNRIWRNDAPERVKALTHALINTIGDRTIEGVLDVHNTSGCNPPYAVLYTSPSQSASLAGHFTDTALVYTGRQALSGAFDQHYPSVTLECGKLGTAAADRVAWNAVQKMRDDTLDPDGTPPAHCYTIVAEVQMTDGAQLLMHYDALRAPLRSVRYLAQRTAATMMGRQPFSVHHDVEQLNLRPAEAAPLSIGHFIGNRLPLRVLGDNHTELDIDAHFTHHRHSGAIYVRPEFTVAMATRNAQNIRTSCLFYLVRCQSTSEQF